MQYLHAPWRSEYFKSKNNDLCPFCSVSKELDKDEERGVIFRKKYCFGIMNLYPYSPGHFMVIPYEHLENIEDLSEEAWQEISSMVRFGVKILKQTLHAKGVNIGMNLGEQAGAGIAPHCHYHLVPRWAGDTNFITTIAQTRVCGKDLGKIYLQIKQAYKEYLC
ncbi:HIT domain-containing protein [Campylobacter sp. CCS1377]|uniref:HIT domain-containing protein n=1 Tax=Campylobacter sp. CCS1377 TaxID=3158229 RepID=A0AAU7E6E1_9BACT